MVFGGNHLENLSSLIQSGTEGLGYMVSDLVFSSCVTNSGGNTIGWGLVFVQAWILFVLQFSGSKSVFIRLNLGRRAEYDIVGLMVLELL